MPLAPMRATSCLPAAPPKGPRGSGCAVEVSKSA